MEAYIYETINQVPKPWRTYKSAKLSLEQINGIVADAALHAIQTTNPDGTLLCEVPDLGGARRRFADSHHIDSGFWVSGAEGVE